MYFDNDDFKLTNIDIYFDNYIFLKAKLKKLLKNRYRSNLIIRTKAELILMKNKKWLYKKLNVNSLNDEELARIAKYLIKG